MTKPKLSIIIPAFNEADSLGSVLKELIVRYEDMAEIIVVNDGSTDNTAEVVTAFTKVTLVNHKRNYGYGAALKTGISLATSDWLCFYDADGQHNPDDILRLYEASEKADMVVGARQTAVPFMWRRAPGKLILHWLANFMAGQNIPDVNSGLRLLRRDVILRYLHLLPDSFSASTTTTMILVVRGYDVVYIPIQAKRREQGRSQVRQLKDGGNTIMLMLRIMLLFNPTRFFIPFSVVFVGLGTAYGVYKIFDVGLGLSSGSLLLILIGLLSFVLGLLFDQISSLRLEKLEDPSHFRRGK
jgi:glycosyltransferase involved in cell wall biosynthesis